MKVEPGLHAIFVRGDSQEEQISLLTLQTILVKGRTRVLAVEEHSPESGIAEGTKGLI